MLTKEYIDKSLSPNEDMQVYYDHRTDILFTVWRTEGDKIIIGGLSEWYDSARTGLFRYAISKQYFDGCQPISKDSDLLVDYHFASGFTSKILRGYGDVHKTNPWYKYICNNPEFEYLSETDELVNANIERNPCLDFDFSDDYDD
jgi:hypothetical protein